MRVRKSLIAAACIFFAGQSLQAQWQYNGSSIYYNGNVGVGTTAPAALLHVDASNQGTGNAIIFNKSVSVPQTYVFDNVGGISSAIPSSFWRGFHLGAPVITQNGNPTWSRLSIYANVNSFADPTSRTWAIECGNSTLPFDMAFRIDDAEVMHLRNNGNVGIGISNPQAKLAVNGDIFSKKVKVSLSGWPDYVFYNNYRLRSLNEVEQYINQYHHLPEVVSAEEVEKNGLDVGDNQAALLKKIEELTLYVIELNKHIQELELKEKSKTSNESK